MVDVIELAANSYIVGFLKYNESCTQFIALIHLHRSSCIRGTSFGTAHKAPLHVMSAPLERRS